jgi:hypothetical protein
LTRETLELMPTSRNGLIALMAQAPGVRPNLGVGGNSISSVPSFHAVPRRIFEFTYRFARVPDRRASYKF